MRTEAESRGLTVRAVVLAVIICVACTIKWSQILTGRCGRMCELQPEGDLLRLAQGTEVAD